MIGTLTKLNTCSKLFPPTEQDSSTLSKADDGEFSPSPEILAAKLPDPPTVDPNLDGQPEAKKQKFNSEDLGHNITTTTDEKSEDDWEEVDKSEGVSTELLDDDPVEVDRASSAADVHSVQSSGILSTDGVRSVDNMLLKDW